MYQQFTDRARKVMALANLEAQHFHNEYIDTEHILLGLVKEGSGVGAKILNNLGVDLRNVRPEVEKLRTPNPDMRTMGKLPPTLRAKKVIEHALKESLNLNHNYVGTEHLLLGLVHDRDGVAAQILMNLGLKLDDLRNEILSVIGSGTQDQPLPGIDPLGIEQLFHLLGGPLAHRISQAARNQSLQTGRPVTPINLIRQVLEQHFPPDQPDATR